MERQTWRGGRRAREFGQRAAPEAEGARLRAGGAPVGAGRAAAERRELLWRQERAQRERAQWERAQRSSGRRAFPVAYRFGLKRTDPPEVVVMCTFGAELG